MQSGVLLDCRQSARRFAPTSTTPRSQSERRKYVDIDTHSPSRVFIAAMGMLSPLHPVAAFLSSSGVRVTKTSKLPSMKRWLRERESNRVITVTVSLATVND